MVYEFVGAKSGKFKADDGKEISYAKICVKVPFESFPNGLDGWIGSNWDVLRCPYDNFDKLVAGLEDGDHISVTFDRNGKVESLNLVGETE